MAANQTPGDLEQLKELRIFSNYSGDVEVGNGILDMVLYESILDYSVRATVTFVDTGYRNSEGSAVMEGDDLNLTSGEKVEIKVTDQYDQTISCKGDYHLRINKIVDITESTNKEIVSLSLYSKECIENEFQDTRVVKRYDGKITDSVNSILSDTL